MGLSVQWKIFASVISFKMRTGQTFQENSSQNGQQQGRMSLRYQYEACQLHILRSQCTFTMCCDIHIKPPSKRKQGKKKDKINTHVPQNTDALQGWVEFKIRLKLERCHRVCVCLCSSVCVCACVWSLGHKEGARHPCQICCPFC